jgi:hypothetical protein
VASSSAPLTGGLTFPAGNPEVVQIAYTAQNGASFDITGYSATWSFGAYNADGTRGPALVTKSSAAGTLAIIVSAGASFLSFTLQPSDTSTRVPGTYWTQLAVYTPSGVYDGGDDDTLTLLPAEGANPGAVLIPGSSGFFGTDVALTADTDSITADGAVVKALGGSFADLQAQVLDYLDRPELVTIFPAWARLFQSKLNRLLRVGGCETQAVLTPSPITGGAALPNDYQAWRSVVAAARPSWSLEYATPDALSRDRAAWRGGLPRLFTIKGAMLFPAPVAQVVLTYYRGVPSYLSGAVNDWLLLSHFDLYLYGVLCEAEIYLKNDERAAMWEQRAANALTDLIASDRDARWGKSSVRTFGATP